MSLIYGSDGLWVTVRPSYGVGMSDLDIGTDGDYEFDGSEPGIISTFVLDRGRYVNAEMHRLPPLE